MTTSIHRWLLSGLAVAAVLGAALAGSGDAKAGTLENLERERALVIQTLIDPTLSPERRLAAVTEAEPRLVDLERMVLRDDSLRGRATPNVRRAFGNYDLTFMVHAAAEKNVAIVDNWLGEMGLTTQSLMAARKGRR